ncbi:MAG: hypothetical protein GY940_38145, partial [bacterium]|nr:hypothetical protein [bacterium]
IPLNPNGKVDRRALPEPGIDRTPAEYAAPRDEVEKKLALIWAEELGLKQVQYHDNFFDLGGHSLKAIQIVNEIHNLFEVKLSLRDLFQCPTLEGLANIIKKAHTSGCTEIEIQPGKEYYELSYTQNRLWYVCKMEPHNPMFNMPIKITFHETIENNIIKKVLEKLIFK